METLLQVVFWIAVGVAIFAHFMSLRERSRDTEGK